MTPLLTGWGRTAPSAATLVEAAVADVPALLRDPPDRGVIARGLGRSYGDAAQNAGGTVLVPIAGPTTIHRAADGTPLVTAASGTSLHDLMAALLAARLFVPVTPGTRYVTLGGAVAADIHGKNHHRDGTFGEQVVSLDLVTADGGLHSIGPDTDPVLFWATVGGMGLTGVITSVTLRALPVESAYVTVRTERIGSLDALMRTMREHDDEHRYSVAWIDTMARGRSLGRSVLTRGDHATEAELTGAAARHPWRAPQPPRLSVPLTPPGGLVSRPAVRAFNELWFRKAPREGVGVESIASFFHPLDHVASWNRLYGRGGLVQYQLVVPEHAENALTEALRLLSDAGQPSFLAVLKRFGATNPGLLSFPVPGWTLALDLPAGPALGPLFRTLDRLVVEAGGRLYLAKDSRLSPETFDLMYERAGEFRKLRRELDPNGVLQSDLARRLSL
jgi:decaprenylphospho-beta-D-ribofuranose 2-oxidase